MLCTSLRVGLTFFFCNKVIDSAAVAGYSRLVDSGPCQRRPDINAAQIASTANASDVNVINSCPADDHLSFPQTQTHSLPHLGSELFKATSILESLRFELSRLYIGTSICFSYLEPKSVCEQHHVR